MACQPANNLVRNKPPVLRWQASTGGFSLNIDWTIRPASPSDLSAIESLRRANGADLGFIPKARYEHIVNKTLDRGRRRWFWERLVVCEDNGDITGFVLANIGRQIAKIEQVCVRNDARRMERALSLCAAIELEAEARSLAAVKCRVAADIEANWYWRTAGYEPVGTATSTFMNQRESKSRRLLILYIKTIESNSLFPTLPIRPRRARLTASSSDRPAERPIDPLIPSHRLTGVAGVFRHERQTTLEKPPQTAL